MISGIPNSSRHLQIQAPTTGKRSAPPAQVAPTGSPDQVAPVPSGFRLQAGDFAFEIPSNQQVSVGRRDGSDLQLEAMTVSREHAALRVRAGQVEICDVGSSLGTLINGKPLEPNQWRVLPPGATVSFATADFKLASPNEPTQSALAQHATQSGLQVAQQAVGGVTGFLLQDSLGQQFTLQSDGEYTLGRDPESSIPIRDGTVSRYHGRLRMQDGQLSIRDAGSTNGTSINGRKIDREKWVDLPQNARIQLGDALLSLSQVGQPAPLPQQGLAAGLGAVAGVVGGPLGVALRTGLQLSDLSALASKQELESKESYLASLGSAQAQLDQESGIVDLPRGVPSLVLSDIHARREFIMKALEHEVDGVKVFDLLKSGRINVVCVGDGMHAEGRAATRWRQAEQDMIQGKPSPALHQEMIEGFGTMKMIMDLKAEYPENFHFLRGNHDEIKGNFAKYARTLGESAIVQRWVTANLGQDFLDKYARFEETLPLVVRGQGFVASHAAPGGQLDKTAIERRDPKAFAQLAWTENRNWNEQDPQVQSRFQKNLQEVGGEGGRWLVGHRPVEEGDFRSQFDGQLVQINAPNDFIVALVPPNGQFQPERDIIRLERDV